MSEEGYITLPPDSTGKRVRTIVKTINGSELHHEVMCITSPRTLYGVYQFCPRMLTGSKDADYVYHVLYNPDTAERDVAIRRIWINVVTINPAKVIEMAVWRINQTDGGVDVDPSYVAKKDTNYPDPVTIIKEGDPTNPITVTTTQKLFSFVTPNSSGQTIGIYDLDFTHAIDRRSDLILHPGEGICIRNEESGDTDFRVVWIIEWEEYAGIGVIK